MTHELVKGVHVFPHSHVAGKNAIIFGKSGALAVDACMHREEGDAMASFIRERGMEPELLAVTHGHPDHILGSHVFRGGEVIAHVNHHRLVEQMARRHAEGTGRPVDDVLADIARPTVLFEREYQVDLGDREVLLFHSPGHTPDSACVYLPEERVLIGGDTVVTGILPAFADGNGFILEATLRRIAALDVDHLIPGHGSAVSGAEVVKGWMLWMADYLAGLRRHVEPLLELTDVDLVGATPFEEFVEGRFEPEHHDMMKRHETAILMTARELRAASESQAEIGPGGSKA